MFFVPGSIVRRPIDHVAMNRNPVLRLTLDNGDLVLSPGVANKRVELEGEPFVRSRRLARTELRRGLILTVGRGFAFCIHEIQYPMSRAQDLGLLGVSDAMEGVRRAITGVPEDEALVLLRGESCTGKELAARALHDSSSRSKGPFVAVNTATLNAGTATSVLFGHDKGAFTGATEAKPGYFRAAHGGTLFLDEIGLMPYDVQGHLLRVLQDRTVHPLNSHRQQKVDVRVVAATDMPLEKAVNDGRFVSSLLSRLMNGVTINLPPLRERREDIGLLLVAFLRAQLGGAAKLQRIQFSPADGSGWLSSETIAAIARSPLPGNVRDLEGEGSASLRRPRHARYQRGRRGALGPARQTRADPDLTGLLARGQERSGSRSGSSGHRMGPEAGDEAFEYLQGHVLQGPQGSSRPPPPFQAFVASACSATRGLRR